GTQPAVTQMRVSTGAQSADFSFDNTGMWEWDPGWNWHAWTFKASGSSTTLEFYSLQSGPTRTAIDSVTVELTALARAGVPPPAAFALSPVVPNPLAGSGQLGFAVPRTARVHLAVRDVAGREVAVLRDEVLGPGRYSAAWNGGAGGARCEPGLYFIELA